MVYTLQVRSSPKESLLNTQLLSRARYLTQELKLTLPGTDPYIPYIYFRTVNTMPHECVICAEPDSEATPLLELPCLKHWVCRDGCIAQYFKNATLSEALYPPQCCRQPFSLNRFAEHVPDDVKSAFLSKEQGEYTVLPK
jgi:hypothetical protein